MNIQCLSRDPEVIQRFQQLMFRLQSEQNLALAACAGGVAAILSGGLWALVTVMTGYQIGWMAVGVGFAVGHAVRLGKGIDKIFGYLSAALALAGCLIGNLFTIFGFISKDEGVSLWQVFSLVDYSKLPGVMMNSFSPIDLLFYGIAIWEGYRFAFRPLNSEEHLTLVEAQGK